MTTKHKDDMTPFYEKVPKIEIIGEFCYFHKRII